MIQAINRLLFPPSGLQWEGRVLSRRTPWSLGELLILFFLGTLLPLLGAGALLAFFKYDGILTAALLMQPLILLLLLLHLGRKHSDFEMRHLLPRNIPWLRFLLVAFVWMFFLRVLAALGAGIQSLFGVLPDAGNNPLLFMDAPSRVELFILFLSVGLLVPIAEEIFYRGILYRYIGQRAGALTGALVSSVVWALLHGSLALTFPLFLIGLALVVLYESTGELWAPIAAHVGFNLSSLLAVLLIPGLSV